MEEYGGPQEAEDGEGGGQEETEEEKADEEQEIEEKDVNETQDEDEICKAETEMDKIGRGETSKSDEEDKAGTASSVTPVIVISGPDDKTSDYDANEAKGTEEEKDNSVTDTDEILSKNKEELEETNEAVTEGKVTNDDQEAKGKSVKGAEKEKQKTYEDAKEGIMEENRDTVESENKGVEPTLNDLKSLNDLANVETIPERADPEDMEEADPSLLSQWSSTPKDDSDVNLEIPTIIDRRGSPIEGDDDQASSTYHSFGELESPPITPGDVANIEAAAEHLDPISERDESDEESDDDRPKMPSKLKSSLSGAMLNLNAIGQESPEASDAAADESNTDESVEESESSESSEGAEGENNEDDEQVKDKTGMKETVSKEKVNDAETAGAESREEKKKRRSKRGRISRKKKPSPVNFGGGIRTFNNPISYLGGPNIEYEEPGGGGAIERKDSITSLSSMGSVTSLD